MIFKTVPLPRTFMGNILSPSPARIDRINILRIINTDPALNILK